MAYQNAVEVALDEVIDAIRQFGISSPSAADTAIDIIRDAMDDSFTRGWKQGYRDAEGMAELRTRYHSPVDRIVIDDG